MSDQSKIIIDELRILDFFHDMKETEGPVLIWTQRSNSPGRILFFCHVGFSNLVDFEVGLINNNPSNSFEANCIDHADAFVYEETHSVLAKTKIKRFHKDLIILEFPKKINIVADKLKLNVQKTIEALDPNIKKIKQAETIGKRKDEHGFEIETPEDQEKYSSLRASPRGKVESGQVAKIQVKKSNQLLGTSKHEVFDISRGGISLLSTKPFELEKDDEITILTINEDPPPFPLVGKVVSIKRIDLKSVKYRIGIKFD